LAKASAFAAAHNVLFIADEVHRITRTGRLATCEIVLVQMDVKISQK
jgi:acetylornithine/succinyldiaminopimelate/putrescine aminotransferase